MNTALVTTGIKPLAIGSTELFQLAADLDMLPWNLAGGTVYCLLRDPTGALITIPATISGGGYTVTAPWTVVGPVGNWTRAWDATDASGIRQITDPLVFAVTTSP